MMFFLVGLGLLVAFSAALLNPYGRRLLAVMFGVCLVIVAGIAWLGVQQNRASAEWHAEQTRDQMERRTANAACSPEDLAGRGNPYDTGADGSPCSDIAKKVASR